MILDTTRMRIQDISMQIFSDMPVYKGKASKRPSLQIECDFTTGNVCETLLHMNMHTGTHLDRQLHMIPGGNTVETLELEKVVTECRVIDCTAAETKVTREDLIGKEIRKGEFILLKTKNSYMDILENDFIWLDKTGAEYLRDIGIKGVGIDSLGIERNQPGHETHLALLNSDIVILEGLRLKDVEEGKYLLIAAPIPVIGAEAAPVRALLLD